MDENMGHNYRIVWRIGDVNFEIESTDKTWVDEKEKDYLVRLASSEDQSARHSAEVQKNKKIVLPENLTIKEFYRTQVKANKIESRPDLAVFFIYFLEKILKKETVKSADVIQCFADISYPSYNKLNFPDILSRAKRKGYLNYVNNQWSLTLTGEDFIINIITKPEE